MSVDFKIDYKEIIRQVSFEQLISYLGLAHLKKVNPSQYKGTCPFCHGEKCFAITLHTDKYPHGAFRCFKCPNSGDQLELVSLMRGSSRRHREGVYAAAKELQERFCRTVPENSPNSSPRSAQGNEQAVRSRQPEAQRDRLENIRRRLRADHESVVAAGIEPDFAASWDIGFCPTGSIGGRIGIALHNGADELIGFCGVALEDDRQPFRWPDNLDLQSLIFPCNRLQPGKVRIVSDPLEVVRIFQAFEGEEDEQAICFATPTISPHQYEMLAALYDEKGCEGIP